MKITQLYFYHKDARKMQLANFFNTYGYTAMQFCLNRLSLNQWNSYVNQDSDFILLIGPAVICYIYIDRISIFTASTENL